MDRGAGGNANGNIQHNLKQFHYNDKSRQGYILAIDRLCAIPHQQNVVDDSNDHDGKLGQQT